MNHKYYLIVFLVLSLVVTCACGRNSKTDHLPADSTIVVIFKEAPNQAKIPGFSRKIYAPSYTAKESGDDTLRIKRQFHTPLYEILHLYGAYGFVCFPIVPGDTVLFRYDSTGYPAAESLTSPRYTRYYNLINTTPGSRMKNGYGYMGAVTSPILRMFGEKFFEKNYWSDEEYQLFTSRLNARIDSLREGDEISRQFYDYYKLVAGLNQITAGCERDQIEDKYARFCYFQKHFYPYLDDKLVYQTSYTTYCLAVWSRYSQDDQNRFFYWVKDSDSIPPVSKKLMLELFLSKLDDDEIPGDTLLKYTRLYVETTGDTVHQKKLAAMEQSGAYTLKHDLQLVSLQGDTLLFQDLLKQYKGKVVYVDYWASWCAPCRREMPNAKKLREEYKGKDIVFVYLALNDRSERWQAAVKKEETDYLGENYLINNSRVAKMLDELSIKEIPRFMIYDKTGKLVEANAPRPGTQDVRKLIDRYLKSHE